MTGQEGGGDPVRPAAARPRAHAAHALLAAGAVALVALAVLAAEMVARFSSPDYLVATRGLHAYSDVYGWAMRPRTSAIVGGRRVTVNERGYRGRALRVPRAPGLTRAVVLGDSIAFGLDVGDEETFSSQIDRRDNGIEVANLGVQGYGPDQSLLVLEREGLRLEPDIVVLAFCLANDFADVMVPYFLYDGRTPKPRFRLVGEELVLDDATLLHSAARRAAQHVHDHSHLFNRLAGLARPSPPPPGRHWRERHEEALLDQDQSLRLTLALVRRMDALCRERGAAFLVAVFPDRFSYRAMTPLVERFVAALRADGLPLLDLGAGFRQAGLRLKHVALDGQGHLSPQGHSLVSEELEAEIVRLCHRVPRAEGGAGQATGRGASPLPEGDPSMR